jgi:hypothetical protein
MATVVRRAGSKISTAFFRDHTGRQYCLSTKETGKRRRPFALALKANSGQQCYARLRDD